MEKILVIQTAFIGDAILTLPMIQKLKELFPGSFIDVLAIPSTAEIFESSPAVKNVIVMDKKGKDKSFFALMKLAGSISRQNYSRIYSPHRSFRSAFIVLESGVRETYGFSNSSLKYVYKNIVEYKSNQHEVRRNLDLIGFEPPGEDWRIIPQVSSYPELKEKISCSLKQHNLTGNIAAVAPGSVWNTKKYPAEYYDVIINHLRSKFSIILLGGTADIEVCRRFTEKFPDLVSFAGSLSLIESVELLRRVKILICNDSAPTHMGMCAEIPVLTLYCSTVSRFGFFPYNAGSSFMSFDDLPCKPCGIHGFDKCPIGTFPCGFNLKPGKVILKIEEMIGNES